MTIDEWFHHYNCQTVEELTSILRPSNDFELNQVKCNCYKRFLDSTDYVVVKSMEQGVAMPNGFVECRQEIRNRIQQLENEINNN